MLLYGLPAAAVSGLSVVLVLTIGCGGAGSSTDTGETSLAAAGSPAGASSPGSPARWKDPPGAGSFDPALVRRIQTAVAARGAAYRPRTRHLHPDGAAVYTNRLILETSPYLIQHAHNPVNWYPWGDEAFETAKRLGRPVLLSVGYSTCHWCHVMEEESFEDEEIARVLNEGYVAVKVDREQRPDVDAIYMAAVEALTGGGGWPMTVWLTPERKPFFGGTYFPARDGDRGARIGFLTLLRRLRESYGKPDSVLASAAEQITEAIQARFDAGSGGKLPGPSVLRSAADSSARLFDPEHGGVRGAPKFPSSLPVRFLLRHHSRTGEESSRTMAVRTLERMAAGGIHDQIGGGFHRYSTDARWHVPHFEKMLYDNALLVPAYLEAYQVTGREDFAQVARGVLGYVLREMTSPQGVFYSATDADSPGPDGRREEGLFFTWTPAEIEAALGRDRAALVTDVFGVTDAGHLDGRSVPYLARSPEAAARDHGLEPEAARARFEKSRGILYDARARRPPPLRDEKILTAWNGLMITALARGSRVLGEAVYARSAAKAADFLLRSSRRDGRLLRAYPGNGAPIPATLSDYTFLIAGLLDLYEATHDPRWLREAIALDAVLQKHYEDPDRGGYFLTADDAERLLAREKPAYDGAEPSGNSVAAMNLLRLYELTTREPYRVRAERTIGSLGEALESSPLSLSEMLLAADFLLDAPREIVIVTPRGKHEADGFLAKLGTSFVPNHVLVVAVEGKDLEDQSRLVPLLEGKTAIRGRATAYVCERRVCRLPTPDPGVFAEQIARVTPLAPDGRAPQPGQ
jgi:hypothetical protein